MERTRDVLPAGRRQRREIECNHKVVQCVTRPTGHRFDRRSPSVGEAGETGFCQAVNRGPNDHFLLYPDLSSLSYFARKQSRISLESSLAMVKPSAERLHPFSPGGFSGFSDDHFYPSQLAGWKCSRTQARNFVQVNRLWWHIAERFLYSTFYVEEEWRVQGFIDTVELNSNLALC